MEALKAALSVLLGFSGGVVIAGAVFAFITMIGIVPRMAQKTRTQAYVKWYEMAIVAGGVFGTVMGLFQPRVPLGSLLVAIFSLCTGIFYGCLAMSLAEVLNVIPILSRRGHLQRGMFFFVLAIALGKMAGSLLYYLKPGFYY